MKTLVSDHVNKANKVTFLLQHLTYIEEREVLTAVFNIHVTVYIC